MVRVIVIIGKKAERRTRLMLEVLNKRLIKEIRRLINSRRCEDAVSDILAYGRFIKVLTDKELSQVHSDLILTSHNAYWTAGWPKQK